MGIFYKKYSIDVKLNKMGACFSKQPNSDDDLSARLLSNPQYVKDISAFSRMRDKQMFTPKPTPKPTPSIFDDPHWSFDFPQHVLFAMQNRTLPLCCFGANCTRKSSMHFREFSHDPQNNNGTVGSRGACCMKYPEETAQTSLGGGCVGGIRYRQPPSGEELDESIVTHAGCAFITSDRNVVMVLESPLNKWNFPCGNRNQGETSLACALRETREEFGFDPFVDIRVTQKPTFVKTHVSRKTRERTQTAIYVFEHEKPSDWFKIHFQPNNECSAIVPMHIDHFQHHLRNNADIFRFHDSMEEFAAKML